MPKLEDAGAAAVMPLGAPIGSGLGIQNPNNIAIILERARVPVIVDAGVGTASDACVAMELGAAGVLMNTGIAGAQDPVRMARAMREAVAPGRDAFLAGRIPRKRYATASSPVHGVIGLVSLRAEGLGCRGAAAGHPVPWFSNSPCNDYKPRATFRQLLVEDPAHPNCRHYVFPSPFRPPSRGGVCAFERGSVLERASPGARAPEFRIVVQPIHHFFRRRATLSSRRPRDETQEIC